MEEEQVGQVQALPEDMLADVLRCLPPRSLAVCRCVCKAWHAVIDGRRLLRAQLLPLSMSGIFINFHELRLPEFFSCASAVTTMGPVRAAAVSGDLTSYAPNDSVVGHCNGLLLRWRSVVNPATRQWAPLPRLAPPCPEKLPSFPYLAFDPAVSPYYEVFLMPVVPYWWDDDDPVTSSAKSDCWPPSLCETRVFSSRTGRWEERSFVRRGEPAGTMADMARADDSLPRRHYCVYWHGALYVHSPNNFFCTISLATNEYQVIKPPVKYRPGSSHECYLGRSEKGVYCAILDRKFQFRVWILDESSSSGRRQMKWVLKHRNNLKKALLTLDYSYQPNDGASSWSFEDINYYYDRFPEEKYPASRHQVGSDDKEPPVKPKITDTFHITILGFHPFKEIVYLSNLYSTGLAYHLDSSKVQYLGNMCPTYYDVVAGQNPGIDAAFPYTPCWMENLFTGSA